MTNITNNYCSTNMNNIQSILTPNEIAFFKESLEQQKSKIQKNLNLSSTEMDNFVNYDPKDEGDYASISLEQNLGNKISDIQANNLLLIEKSLNKIKNNCYGICTLCEEPIRTERLKIKMFAEYCISCRELIEKNGS